MSELNGVFPVDKPVGPTSHDVVARARRSLRTRRVGHTGTLDPFASGLLLLCVGRSTRLAEYLTALPKRYSATLRLGIATDTDDLQGEIIRETDAWQRLAPQDVEAALIEKVGDQLQRPPRYSAKRVAGERMHAVARSGREVAVEAVPVRIDRIELIRLDLPEVDFEVDCSSGTYIRSIARDVGEDLGVGAHLTVLRRTRIGAWSVGDALVIEELDDPAAVAGKLRSPAQAVAHLTRVVLSDREVERIGRGQAIDGRNISEAGPLALVTSSGDLVAIGRSTDDSIQPQKVFL